MFQWFRLAPTLFLFVMSTLSAFAQSDINWSDWKSTPNFPGIKIRVWCRDNPSMGDSQWGFQFLNNYHQKVQLTYREETPESTGHPPTFAAPGEFPLDSGLTSAVHSTYLRGSCSSRPQIFIMVVSIQDEHGKRVAAKTGAKRTGTFKVTASSGQVAAESDRDAKNDDNSGSTSGNDSGTAPGQPASDATSRPAENPDSESLAGTTWQCLSTYTRFDGATWNGMPYSLTFNEDGTWNETDPNGATWTGQWEQHGAEIKQVQGTSRRWTVWRRSGNSMSGKEVPSRRATEEFWEETTGRCDLRR